MSYPVVLLKTVAECNALLKSAASDKVDVNYKISGLEREQSNSENAAVGVDSKLILLNVEIAGYQAALADPAKTDSEKGIINGKLSQAINTRSRLLKKDEEYSSVSILKRVCLISRAQQELAALDAMIQEVTTHKATL